MAIQTVASSFPKPQARLPNMTREALIRAMKTYIETEAGDAVARRLMSEALAALDGGNK